MPAITPSLWFDDDLEEAAEFYTSVFPNSSIEGFTRYTDAGPGTPGSVVSGTFVLDGQRFVGINGGPVFSFSEAVSFVVQCADQDEVDSPVLLQCRARMPKMKTHSGAKKRFKKSATGKRMSHILAGLD